jgi:predicted DNA-binding ribbon-helix-helix protein
LLTAIDSERRYSNLSSAIRLFVLNFYRDQLAEVHRREGIDATINNLPAHGYS